MDVTSEEENALKRNTKPFRVELPKWYKLYILNKYVEKLHGKFKIY